MKRVLWMSALLLAGCHDQRLPTTPAYRAITNDLTPNDVVVAGTWSEPVNLGEPVNSTGADQSPTLSADGLSLYFSSDRSGGFGGVDLWVSHRATPQSPWETPVNLGSTINTPDAETGPALSLDGHLLFFASNRAGGEGNFDIYVSHRADVNDDFAWGDPVNLGAGVNSSDGEFGPWYSEDGADGPLLYFARGPNSTFTQLYSAPVTRDGQSRGPASLIAELASPGFTQGHPTLLASGRQIVFYSNRPGGVGLTDLWMATRRSPNDAWSAPVNLGTPLNSTANDLLPTLSRDGRTLFFTSTRPGGVGGMDIWMSTRVAPGGLQ